MHTHQPQQRTAAAGAIPWDDTPSLADTLSLRLVTAGGLRHVDLDLSGVDAGLRQPVSWENTLPAALEPAVAPEPFREAFDGLSMREVREPDVFRHFFDGIATAAMRGAHA